MAAGRTIGVDLGGTKLLAAVVGPDGAIGPRVRREIAGLSREALMACVVDAVGAASGPAPVDAAGFGIPAFVDRAAGTAAGSNHLPLDGVPFAAAMREALGVPVAVDNDGNCAVLAEWRSGAARGASTAVLVALGTGIAGGLVLDGRVFRGVSGAGAELGHMVVDLDGPRCFGSCPGRGCLEAVASGSALARDAAAAGLGDVAGEAVTALALAGDPVAVRVLGELGRRLGAGLAGIAMIFEPEVIVVGGGVSAAGELVVGPAREEMRARVMGPAAAARVEVAALGPEAGMIGAALLAAEEAA